MSILSMTSAYWLVTIKTDSAISKFAFLKVFKWVAIPSKYLTFPSNLGSSMIEIICGFG